MWLNSKQADDMKKYIDKNLLEITYNFPWIPYTTYCSKLVWEAHRYSWKKLIWMMIIELFGLINFYVQIMLEG